ncbi:MAG TPA: FAD binding domain-containing protein [Chloroflexota bacterium]|nr:FAD binding domain-containing protein [Chloroflexota bacterium]
MMRLPPFTYLAPCSLAEAAEMLAEHGPRAMVVAGGTDLLPNMKRRQQEPQALIGLRRLRELRCVEEGEEGWVRVGAMTTLAQAAAHPFLHDRYSAFATAAHLVSTPHLRLMGTIGGNLCLDTRCNYYDQSYHWRKSIDFCMKKEGDICWVAPGSPRCWAVSSSDTAPVTVALKARFRLVSARGERTVDAADIFRDDGILYLARRPDEILAEVLLPPMDGWRTVYLKLRRRGSFDFPILGVAAAVRRTNGTVEDARLVLGAVGSSPVDASAAARPLLGTVPTLEAIEAVAATAYKSARPLDNTDLHYAWRKKMARVYVKRALAQVTGMSLDDREA